MIDERTAELLVERLIRRIEQANTYFLMEIGASIKQLRNLTPSQAQQLIQVLKYDGNYEKIIKEISKYTGLNIKDIDDIFSTYAKKDQLFYEKFYKYRNKPFIPFDENPALKTQTMALSNIVKNEMFNFTRSNVLGYTIKDTKGRIQFLGLRETYNRVLDEAFLNVGQGKETFDSAMTRIIKELGGSGLKTIEYESGRSMRLDSAVQMHLKARLRELHNENQKIFGEEFDYDGIEISVHSNPAPDHELAQGRQFSIEEFDKLQDGIEAKTYDGLVVNLDHDHKNGYRPISELNCYHYVFSIVLGVSKPEYTNEQLQKIIDDNKKGFEYEGKHYTMYEGEQLQRKLERKIREQKDIQIIAKASGNNELILESQTKITQLTNKYKELSAISGLPTKMERMRVSGYRRTRVNKNNNQINNLINNSKELNYEEFLNLKEKNKNNINSDIRNTIYTGVIDNPSEIINEFGYINSDHAKYINEYMRNNNKLTNQTLEYLKQEGISGKKYTKDILYKEYDKTISQMNKAIENNQLPYNLKTHRYLDYNWLDNKATTETTYEELLKNLKGKDIPENQFISTSSTPASVYSDRNVDMILYAKEGTNAFITENIMESEVIFKPSEIHILDYEINDKKINIIAYIKKELKR